LVRFHENWQAESISRVLRSERKVRRQIAEERKTMNEKRLCNTQKKRPAIRLDLVKKLLGW
jgi:hypothetical protein